MTENKIEKFSYLVIIFIMITSFFSSCAKIAKEQEQSIDSNVISQSPSAPTPVPTPAPTPSIEASPMPIPAQSFGNETQNMPSHSITTPDLAGKNHKSKDTKNGKSNFKKSTDKVTSWKRSSVAANTAKLMIGDQEELKLMGSQINVRIDGFRARILIDMFFYNERDRQFEGTFKLRLPNGASPNFFAFGQSIYNNGNMMSEIPFSKSDEIRSDGWSPKQIMEDRAEFWSAPKEARMVAKDKAAFAYEQTVRKRIDPALMEWSGAGVFSAKVFPINPQKMHRIVIGYDTDLVHIGSDLEYRLDLPQNSSNTIVKMQVRKIPGVEIKTIPEAKGNRDGENVFFRYEIPLERSLILKLKGVGNLLTTGEDLETGKYFAAHFRPELPETIAKVNPHAVFLVDISLSSNPDRFNIWLALLKAVLNNNRDSLKYFAVLFFNVETFWWKTEFLTNTPDNVMKLSKYMQTLALEGATDLENALKEAVKPFWFKGSELAKEWDMFLLSDGSPTWGSMNINAISKALFSGKADALFAYQTGFSGTDIRILSHLSRESGGAVFSLVGEEEIQKASIAHRSRPWHLKNIEISGGRDLLLAGRPKALFPGQNLILAGRGNPNADSEVILQIQQGKKEKNVKVDLTKSIFSDLVPRIYGQIAVNQLEDFKNTTKLESEAYARHFRITGQTCSLLMLESEADYRRFQIKPENDAFVVKSTQANAIVKKVINNISNSSLSSKASFIDWIERMKEVPGINFNISPAFKIALDMIPESSFQINKSPLNSKHKLWEGLPGLVREQLRAGKPEYDIFSLEAKRRKNIFGPDDALKALSSLVESKPGDIVIVGDIAYSAMEMGLGGQAFHLFSRVADIRPYEPQAYLSMARCLADMDMIDLALVYYEIGFSIQWDGRFGEFNKILGTDYLGFLRRVIKKDLKTSIPEFVAARLESLENEFKMIKADVLVTITWNTDGTDVDLHVVEPGGEECYYSNSKTKNGGVITSDVTNGFGPEMYMIQDAVKGKYLIRVKYYAKDQNRMSTRTRVFVTIWQNWGTDKETRIRKAVVLETNKQMHDLATIEVKRWFW